LPILLVLAATSGRAGGEGAPPDEKVKPAGNSPYAYVLNTDQKIRYWQDRLKDYPHDFTSQTFLGECQARKARETGDVVYYERAEESLRQALKEVPNFARAQAALAAVLCDRHQFAEGLKMADKAYARDPRNPLALATAGDAHLALGHFAEAERIYQRLGKQDADAAILARQARLAELKGETAAAVRLMHRAVDEGRNAEGPRETQVWYRVRLGDLLLNAGRTDEAAGQYQAALKTLADYRLALAGMGKVYLARGKRADALRYYEKAALRGPEPAMLAPLGDLYLKTGQDFLARVTHDRLERTATQYPEYRRELALFYADHNRKLAQALELAQKEMESRKDLYAYDTLAWALYKNRRYAEAAKAMAVALRLGTQDPSLHFHAGMIQARLGNKAKSRDHLTRALALNPGFAVLQAEEARRTLEELEGKTSR
jgi:tetratricopeptide (TPR) repeat protein